MRYLAKDTQSNRSTRLLYVAVFSLTVGVSSTRADPFKEGEAALLARDYAKAAAFYQIAAEKGNAIAQYNLGLIYGKGDGVGRNDLEAVKWFRRSAELGNARGQFALGYYYLEGRGVEPDVVSAYKWIALAALQQLPQAVQQREILRKQMTPAQIAEGDAWTRSWKPPARNETKK